MNILLSDKFQKGRFIESQHVAGWCE